MLAIPTDSELTLAGAKTVTPAPLPTPTAAPAYVPPTDPYIPLAPATAPAPTYQFLGEGGTPFGAKPPIYSDPLPIRISPIEMLYGDMPDRYNKGALEKPAVLPPRLGEDQIMPVPTGQQPKKETVPAGTEPVQKPTGPISGNIAGFELSRVPLWAWLVAAAFLGSRLLK